jgi:hypothetical protein
MTLDSQPPASPAARAAAAADRQDLDRLSARVVRVEDDAARDRVAARSVVWMAGVAAVLGFVATSLTWRLGDKAAVIDGGLRAATALLERSSAGARAGFERVDGALAVQSKAVAELATTLATVEAAGRQTQAAVAALERLAARDAEAVGLHGRQLTELALEFAHFRRDTETRLAKHHDALLAGRGELLDALTKSIAGIEGVMLRQAEELRTQREDMNATAIQMRARQQRLLGEATAAIAGQLDGLRQIVACLREDAAHEGSPAAADAVTAADATADAAPAPADPVGDDGAAPAGATPAAEVAAEPAVTVTE